MKKTRYKIGCVVCIVLFAAALWFTGEKITPKLENILSCVDVTGNGTFLAAENRKYSNFIYEIDGEGEIVNSFCRRKSFGSRHKQIRDIVCKDEIYVLFEQRVPGGKKEYEVCCLTSDWKKTESLAVVEKEVDFVLKDFTVVDNHVYLTGIYTPEDELQVYALDLEESGEFEQLMLRQAAENDESSTIFHWVDAAYNGSSLFGLTDSGQLLEYNEENMAPFTLKETGEVTWMCGNGNDVIYYDYIEDEFTSVEETDFLELLEGQHGIMEVKYSKDSGDSIAVRRIETGEKQISLYMAGEEYYIDRISFGSRGFLKRVCVMAVLFIMMAGFAAAFLAWAWKKAAKLPKRLAGAAALVLENLVLLLIGFVVMQHWQGQHGLEDYNVSVLAYLTGERMKCSELLAEKEEIIPEEFVTEEKFAQMSKNLGGFILQENDKGDISYQVDVIEYLGEESYVLYSGDHSYGRNIYGMYEKELLQKLEEIKSGDGKGVVTVKGADCSYIYAVQFEEENENNHFLWIAKAEIVSAY